MLQSIGCKTERRSKQRRQRRVSPLFPKFAFPSVLNSSERSLLFSFFLRYFLPIAIATRTRFGHYCVVLWVYVSWHILNSVFLNPKDVGSIGKYVRYIFNWNKPNIQSSPNHPRQTHWHFLNPFIQKRKLPYPKPDTLLLFEELHIPVLTTGLHADVANQPTNSKFPNMKPMLLRGLIYGIIPGSLASDRLRIGQQLTALLQAVLPRCRCHVIRKFDELYSSFRTIISSPAAGSLASASIHIEWKLSLGVLVPFLLILDSRIWMQEISRDSSIAHNSSPLWRKKGGSIFPPTFQSPHFDWYRLFITVVQQYRASSFPSFSHPSRICKSKTPIPRFLHYHRFPGCLLLRSCIVQSVQEACPVFPHLGSAVGKRHRSSACLEAKLHVLRMQKRSNHITYCFQASKGLRLRSIPSYYVGVYYLGAWNVVLCGQ